MVRTNCHTFDPYFQPLHQPKTPLFTKNCHPKSYFFHTVQNLEIFHSKTPNWLEFEKKVPKYPLFYSFCHWKTPYFLPCMHMFVWGASCNLVNTFRCKFNKGDEIKFQFYRLNPPNCALWMNFIGGQRWYTGHYPPGQTQKGIYPSTTLYKSAHLAL